MSLESPTSYSEWYWKHSVDAQKAVSERSEDAMSPQFAALIGDIEDFSVLPKSVQDFLKPLVEPHSAGLDSYLTATGAEFAAEVVKDAFSPVMELFKRGVKKRFKTHFLTPQEAIILHQRKWIDDKSLSFATEYDGYADKVADFIYEAQRPYPSIPDIMMWARYTGDYRNIKPKVEQKLHVSERDFEMWEWLSWQKLTTIQAQELFRRGNITEGELYSEIGRIGWPDVDRDSIKNLAYRVPNAMLVVQGDLLQGMEEDILLEDISKADIHPDYAKRYLDAVLTKPASQDIVAYQLRTDPSLAALDTELKKIGIHPDYTKVYEKLAYQIPPVADIITMAVREAFTPSIVEKFGQAQDFPADLEKYAAMKGLSKEWAEYYWSAHWSLPSSQQGFEMLHRGVINRPELDMLLRAQDVMPFWRDKLTRIAYRPLTRVDVRRMYKEGVLDEGEVFESYLNQGYDDKNAGRMAEFTVKQTLSSLSKFTSSDIIKAFTNRMINRSEATTLLRDIGIRVEDANYIISTAEYKRLWAFTDDQIAAIRNLYKKRIYNENQTRDKLAKLNLPAAQIDVLMQQWYYDKVEELDSTWTTAQTLKFLKRKLISPDRARQELYLNGFTDERINVYLRDLLWTPPKE